MGDRVELRALGIAKVDLSDTLGGTFGGFFFLIGTWVFVVLWVVWGMGSRRAGVRLNLFANGDQVHRDGTTRDCT